MLYGADRAGMRISTSISGDIDNVDFLRGFADVVNLGDAGVGNVGIAGGLPPNVALIKSPRVEDLPVPREVTYRYKKPDGTVIREPVSLPGEGTLQETWTETAFYPDVQEYFSLTKVDMWEDWSAGSITDYTYGSRPGYGTIPTSQKPQRVIDWENYTGREMTQELRYDIANSWEIFKGDRTRSLGYGAAGFRMHNNPITEGQIWYDDIGRSINRTPAGDSLSKTGVPTVLRNSQNGLYTKQTINGVDYAVPSVAADPRAAAALRFSPGEDPLAVLPDPIASLPDDLLAESFL
jgi:hypothetical protein